MRLRKKTRRVVAITVASTFARLLDVIRDGVGAPTSFLYEFEHVVDHDVVVREGLKSISVTVKARVRPSESMWSRSNTSVADVVDSLLMASQRSRVAHLADVDRGIGVVTLLKPPPPQVKQVLARRLGDVRRTNVDEVASLGSAIKILQGSDVKPGLDVIQRASLDLLFKHHIDPANAFVGAADVVTTSTATKGVTSFRPRSMSNVAVSKALSTVNTLFNTRQLQMSELDDDVVVPTVTRSSSRIERQVTTINVPASQVSGRSTFDVEFVTRDGTGVVDRQVHVVKHSQLLTASLTPRIVPRVTVSTSIPGRNVIDITQVDVRAIGVKMYKRTVTNVTDIADPRSMSYVHVGDVPVTRDGGTVKVVDPVSSLGTTMYRFVPYGRDGLVSPAFACAVVRGMNVKVTRRRAHVTCAIDIDGREDGVVVKLANLTRGPVAVALQRKNLTNHENAYTSIGSAALTNNVEDVQFEDRTVKRGSIYDYQVVMFLDDGSSVVSSAHQTYEHPLIARRGIQVITSDPQVKHVTQLSRSRSSKGALPLIFDVTFSVSSNLAALDDDMLRDVLERQGLSDGYASELIVARDKLSDLIAHHVLRYNLSTGAAEDLGILTGDVFSDVAAARVNAARAIVPGTKYKYVITTLLRSPETMFEDFEKSVTSPSDKFASQTTGTFAAVGYTYKPAKFRHPITLQTGTLTSASSRRARHGRDEFMYGAIGNQKVVEVSIPYDDVKLSDIVVDRLDATTNILRWTLQGDPTSVDYFVISTTQMGVDKVIGRVHALMNMSTFEFIHDITDAEVGTTTYTVHAVMTNFAVGANVTSERMVF